MTSTPRFRCARITVAAVALISVTSFSGCRSDADAVSASSAPVNADISAALKNTSWTLVALKGESAPVPAGSVSLAFDTDRRVSGKSAVNRYFGALLKESSGSVLKFGPLAGTRMAGPPEAMALESRYLAALAKVSSARIAGGNLVLSGDADPDLLTFVPAVK